MKKWIGFRLFATLAWVALASACATEPSFFPPSTDCVELDPSAESINDALWAEYRASPRAKALLDMLENNAVVVGDDTMPLHIELFWDEDEPMPADGYPVFISMHGGGAFTPEENQEQWEIQFTRYPGVRGLYVCPHSPMDTWDQWHNERIFNLIDTLVRALLLRDDVDPNRIYLGGYCSGGNGVYQLGPLMADRFAACSATKAIREGGPLDNLRNLPIDIQWGEHDQEALDRPGHNRANVDRLIALHRADPDGYDFRDIEHWRQGKFVNDKSTMRWMSRYTRNPTPDRVVWRQDGDVRPESNPPRHHFYWLGVDDGYTLDGTADYADARLDRATNTIHLSAEGYRTLNLYLNEQMLDLRKPVRVVLNGSEVFNGRVTGSIETAQKRLAQTGDRHLAFPVMIRVEVR